MGVREHEVPKNVFSKKKNTGEYYKAIPFCLYVEHFKELSERKKEISVVDSWSVKFREGKK